MGAVPVDLDAGVGIRLAPGVPAGVVAPVDDRDVEAALGGLLGDGEAEQAGTDDDEVRGVSLSRALSSSGMVPRASAVGGSSSRRARLRAENISAAVTTDSATATDQAIPNAPQCGPAAVRMRPSPTSAPDTVLATTGLGRRMAIRQARPTIWEMVTAARASARGSAIDAGTAISPPEKRSLTQGSSRPKPAAAGAGAAPRPRLPGGRAVGTSRGRGTGSTPAGPGSPGRSPRPRTCRAGRRARRPRGRRAGPRRRPRRGCSSRGWRFRRS